MTIINKEMNNNLSCSLNFFYLAKQIISLSGRGALHRGHYQDCLQDSRMKYALIQLGINDNDLGASVGLCLPKSCSDTFIANLLDQTFKMLGTPLSVFSINSHTEKYQYPLFWLSYLFIAFIILLAVLTFIATIRGYNQKQQSNKFVGCFNIVSNMKHFKVRQGQPLNVWDGVRAFAMMWVVFGHVYLFWLQSKVQNSANILHIAKNPYFLIIEAGIISVDVFFCLGGFFLAFIMLRQNINIKTCFIGIISRVLRVWPAYIFSMFFFYTFYMRLGSGPSWAVQQPMVQYCSTMWHDILFISNYTNKNGTMCLSWGWYLQVDFQLFVLGIFLLYLHSIKPLTMHLTLITLSILSSIYVFVYVILNNVVVYADVDNLGKIGTGWYSDVYTSAYGRCVPYLMGLAFGVVYMEHRKQQKQNKGQNTSVLAKVKDTLIRRRKVRILIEWLGVGLMALVTFIPRPLQTGSEWPLTVHALYWTLSKPIFVSGLILTVLPSCLGISCSFFNLILNAKVLIWIARVSFCTYLVHLMIVFRFTYTRTYDVYYRLVDTFILYMGLLVLSLFFGFWLTMLVELPFANLLKIGLENVKKNRLNKVEKGKNESLLTIQNSENHSNKQHIQT